MPFATKTAARDAILTLFVTAWNAQTPPVPLLLFQDRKEDIPKDGSPYARITLQHNVGDQATLSGEDGNKRFTQSGILTIQIFTQYNNGLVSNDAFTDVAEDVFKGKRTNSDGAFFTNVRTNEIGQDGDWYQSNVIADFQYDMIK